MVSELRPLAASATPFGGPAAGLKNPRGPVTMRAAAGGYLLLFYNNNGKTFFGRNPYWLSAGVEVAGDPPTVRANRQHNERCAID